MQIIGNTNKNSAKPLIHKITVKTTPHFSAPKERQFHINDHHFVSSWLTILFSPGWPRPCLQLRAQRRHKISISPCDIVQARFVFCFLDLQPGQGWAEETQSLSCARWRLQDAINTLPIERKGYQNMCKDNMIEKQKYCKQKIPLQYSCT